MEIGRERKFDVIDDWEGWQGWTPSTHIIYRIPKICLVIT